MREYKLILLKAIGDISLQEDIEERIKTLRLETIGRLQKMLDYYAELGYMDRLLNPIAEKKSEMIAKATSKTEIEKIIKLRCPHYNGNQFFADEYSVPEEELIGWSMTSLRSPLNTAGQARYMEVFRKVFPEEADSVIGLKGGLV